MDRFELEDRLIDFVVLTLEIAKLFPNTYAGNHFGGQLIRSGSSPALNYGEAQSAESRKDFVHKNKIALKELRESEVCLKIVDRSRLIDNQELLNKAIKECDELVSIFVASIKTTLKNSGK